MEIGQGVSTALRQIVADEVDAPLAQVRCVAPSTNLIAPARATVGSDSIKDYALLVAQAAAGLATVIRAKAAESLGLSSDQFRLTADAARGSDGQAIALSALAGDAALLVDRAAITETPPGSDLPGLLVTVLRQAAR